MQEEIIRRNEENIQQNQWLTNKSGATNASGNVRIDGAAVGPGICVV